MHAYHVMTQNKNKFVAAFANDPDGVNNRRLFLIILVTVFFDQVHFLWFQRVYAYPLVSQEKL